MNKTDYYRQKLIGVPTRMDSGKYEKWLSNIDLANDFSELEPLLYEYNVIYPNEPKIEFQYQNILGLFNYKFINVVRMNSYSGRKNVPEVINTGKNIWFDITDYPNQSLSFHSSDILKSLNISITPTKIIDLKNLSNLQSLSIGNVRTVHTIKTSYLDKLKYLGVSGCSKMEDLSCFENANNIIWGEFGANKRMNDISFLKNHSKLMFLSISLKKYDIVNNPSVLDIFKQLPNLRRFFTDLTNKKEKALLREVLPNCFGNF